MTIAVSETPKKAMSMGAPSALTRSKHVLLRGCMLSVPDESVQWSIEAMCVNAATRRKRLHEISRFNKNGEWWRGGRPDECFVMSQAIPNPKTTGARA